jgi:DNA-directed RNA polymerase subunit N (RpoN/RPB10)
MLYYKCPTCRTLLANKQLVYENEIKNIINNQKLSDEQKNIEKEKILDKLFIMNICCRMRTLTYCKKIEIVK